MINLKRHFYIIFMVATLIVASAMSVSSNFKNSNFIAHASSTLVTIDSNLAGEKISSNSSEEIVLTITLKNNTNGIAGLEFTVEYDNNAFDYISAEKTNLFAAADVQKVGPNIKILTYNIGGVVTQNEFFVASLTFKLKSSSVAAGDYTFKFVDEDGVLVSDQMGQPIPAVGETLTITVEGTDPIESLVYAELTSNLIENKISVDSTENFVITVMVKNNLYTIAGLEFDIEYNQDVFEFVSAQTTNIFTAANAQIVGNIFKILTYNLSGGVTQDEFFLANLTFKLNDAKKAVGNYEFKFSERLISNPQSGPIDSRSNVLLLQVEGVSYDTSISSLSYPGISFLKNDNRWVATVPYNFEQVLVQNFTTNKSSLVSILFNGLSTGSIALNEGANQIEVVLSAPDETFSTYYVDITRTPGNTNTDIASVTVKENNSSVTVSKNGDTFTVQNAVQYSNRNNVKVSIAKPQDSKSTLTFDGSALNWATDKTLVLAVGENTFNFVVTPEKGEAKQYLLIVNVAQASQDNSITNLTHSALTLTRNVDSWSATVPYSVSQISIAGFSVQKHEKATVTFDGKTSGNIALNEGQNTINLVVKAEDGTEKQYEVVIERQEGNTNTDIDSVTVKVNSDVVSHTKTGSQFIVDSLVTYENRNNVKVLLTKPEESKATLKVNGAALNWNAEKALALEVGDNTITIAVTPEKGAVKQYTLLIKVEEYYHSTITSLTYSGISLSKSGNRWAATTDYNIETLNISNFVTDKQTSATITFNGLTSGTIALIEGLNTIEVVVTAKNATTSTYFVDITRKQGNTNTDIQKLTVKNGSTTLSVTKTNDAFKVTNTIPYSSKNNIKLAFEKPSASFAALSVNDQSYNWLAEIPVTLVAGVNIINVLVTPQKGSAKQYTVEITVMQSSTIVTLETDLENNQISTASDGEFIITVNISGNQDKISGVEFDLSYNMSVFSFVSSTHSNAFNGIDIKVVGNILKILAYNISGSNTNSEIHIADLKFKLNKSQAISGDYEFKFTELLISDNLANPIEAAREAIIINVYIASSNNTITSIVYPNIELIKDGSKWAGQVPYSTQSVDIEKFATDKHQKANITFNNKTAGSVVLVEGKNTINVIVEAENGARAYYTIEITREVGNTNTNIENVVIKLNNQELVFSTTPQGFVVSSIIPYANRNDVKIILTKPENSLSTAKVKGQNYTWGQELSLELAVESNNITVEVSPEKGTAKNYIVVINVEKPSSNANLSSLLITYEDNKPIQLNPSFRKEETRYSAQVKTGTEVIVVSAVAEHEKATIISGVGSHTFASPSTVVMVKVEAEDGTIQTYEVTIVDAILPSDNNKITHIEVQGYDINFDSMSVAYILTVPYSKTSISIIARAEDPNATVYGADQNLALVEGDNRFVVYAESQSGEIGTKYYITVTRQSRDTVVLEALKVLGFSFNQEFNPASKIYQMIVPQTVSRITIEAVLPEHLNYYEIVGANMYHDLPNIGLENKNYIIVSVVDKSEASNRILSQYTIEITRYTEPYIEVEDEVTNLETYLMYGVFGALLALNLVLITSNILKRVKFAKVKKKLEENGLSYEKINKQSKKKNKKKIENVDEEEIVQKVVENEPKLNESQSGNAINELNKKLPPKPPKN